MDADERDRLGDRLGPASDLDASRLPRGQDVVDYDGRSSGIHNVSILLGSREVAVPDVDRFSSGL